MRRAGLVIAALVVLAVVVAATHKGNSNADVHLVDARSYCQAQPLNAQIVFSLTFRNTGSHAESFHDVIPYRRYSDGTENMSGVDAMSGLRVPAGSTRTYFAKFDYNAESHDLLECGLIKVDESKIIPLTMRRPG